MRSSNQEDKLFSIPIVTISCALIFIAFALQEYKGFSLWDEGFLWYGVQRVLQGEVPIRDFMAYDPGRYYWSAALLSVLGDDGIIALRASISIFQALGLYVGLLLIARAQPSSIKRDWIFWLLSAGTILMWMYPRHKIFDISISILLVGAITYSISNPIPRRHFVLGICVGGAAVFGRNHGIYGLIGALGAIAWLSIKPNSDTSLLPSLLHLCGGILVGFSPVLLMLVFVPGFPLAFWKSIIFLFQQKATNLPLPVPWPWTVQLTMAPSMASIREILIGYFFCALLSFGLISVCWIVIRKIQRRESPPALVASALLTLPYAHFAFSRADIGHLCQGIFPALLGCLVILSRQKTNIKVIISIVLFGTSTILMSGFQPAWQCWRNPCVEVEISGSNLEIDENTSADVAMLRQLVGKFTEIGQSFVTVPFWPGAYALFERKAPMWEIYPVFPRTLSFETEEIKRIRASNPGFALIVDLPLDGREDLRFKNTHPETFKYITDNFVEIPNSRSSAYLLYRAKSHAQ